MNKEQIKIQIEDLRANLEALERELNKPEEFKFKYEARKTNLISSFEINTMCKGDDKDYLSNFRYRQTEANAKADFQLQKELMCIGALAEQIDPDYKARAALDNAGWMVCRNIVTKKYIITNKSILEYLGVVYMPLDVAEKVCEILNNKEAVF